MQFLRQIPNQTQQSLGRLPRSGRRVIWSPAFRSVKCLALVRHSRIPLLRTLIRPLTDSYGGFIDLNPVPRPVFWSLVGQADDLT